MGESFMSSSDLRLLVHEIRSPLTVIDAATHLMTEALKGNKTTTTEGLLEMAAAINRSTARIEALLRQTFRELEMKEADYHVKEICPVIDYALEQAKDRLLMGDIQVFRHYEPGFPIHCQEKRLLMAFINIITNATEAMEKGGSLFVDVAPVEDHLQVRFRDNGCGIPADKLNRLLHWPYTSKTHGLGVGLTLVKEIMDAHKATIEISSTVGEGTTVTIRFPQVKKPSKNPGTGDEEIYAGITGTGNTRALFKG